VQAWCHTIFEEAVVFGAAMVGAVVGATVFGAAMDVSIEGALVVAAMLSMLRSSLFHCERVLLRAVDRN
jgi:hypothetical protein